MKVNALCAVGYMLSGHIVSSREWMSAADGDKAKELRLCFRCMSSKHQAGKCPRNMTCGIDGCKFRHNRLLHEDRTQIATDSCPETTSIRVDKQPSTTPSSIMKPETQKLDTVSAPPTLSASLPGERESRAMTTTMANDSGADSFVALRTIPVIVRNGATALLINAPLHDASSKSYINSDTVSQFGLEGNPEKTDC